MNHTRMTQLRQAGFKTAMAMIFISIITLVVNGLNFGIEFTGGVLTRFTTEEAVTTEQVHKLLADQVQGQFSLSSAKDATEWSVHQESAQAKEHYKVWFDKFVKSAEFSVQFLDSDAFGPQIGAQLVNQGGLALIASLVAILLYLALRFEWRLAVGAITALFHDVTVVLGVFALTGLEFNLTVLAAILAVIGYSLNDSIIVADRVRELMRVNKDSSLDRIINAAISSTMTRTLVTSGTTLATIGSIWLLAGKPLQGFAVSLFTGILVGTLSSICISATVPALLGLNVDHYKIKPEEEQLLEP